MSDATPSRLGQVNQANSATALFLKVFAGEVLTAFNATNIAMNLTRVRTISNGKSAQFPMTGIASATDHTPGTYIDGTAINHNEKVIDINGLKISSAFIANIDEAMNHYDVRSIYSKEIGQALAKAADIQIFKDVASASADQTNYAQGASQNGGSVELGGSSMAASGQQVADAIFSCLQVLDEKNVTGERSVVVTPQVYWKLFGGKTADAALIMNSDFGGSGNTSSGSVPTIGGARVYVSNNLPSTADNTATSWKKTAANGTVTNANEAVHGLVFTKDAAATVKLLDLSVESEYEIQRQGTLMVAKYAMGHGSLRPEAAVRIIDAS